MKFYFITYEIANQDGSSCKINWLIDDHPYSYQKRLQSEVDKTNSGIVVTILFYKRISKKEYYKLMSI